MLLAAVGGGVDISRAYMVKTNLQSACDAGVLAGRKALSRTGDYGSAEQEKADKMFAFNFRKSAAQSHDVTFTSEAHEDGSVTGTATATMPTTIMAVFKFSDMDLKAECSAELQMASVDVLFVLDTTGSMNCAPGVTCGSSTEQTNSKISALRTAIGNFHKTVAAAVVDQDRTRVRYAFVPYSMTVNVGGLVSGGQMPASYIYDSAAYQTRLANFGPDKQYKVASVRQISVVSENKTFSKSKDCNDWAGAASTVSGGPPPATETVIEYTKVSYKNSVCIRNKTTSERTYDPTPSYAFSGWTYEQKTNFNTSGFTTGPVRIVTAVDAANATAASAGAFDVRTLAEMAAAGTASNVTTAESRWSGCIEERDTVQQLSMSPIPSGAYDLDINSKPTSRETSWKPYWGAVEYNRSGTQATERCPAAIQLFKTVDTSNPTEVPADLASYIAALVAGGNTYHDIGMIWGGRIGSTRGIFASNVTQDADKFPSVSRHIIFMTDGDMEPTTSGYSAYGIESLDHRVAPAGTSSTRATDYHNNRFLAACAAAEAEGYTVWLIAFGTSITSQMMDCSTANRAYYASNPTELNSTFRYIAGQVADLRLKR